MSEKPAGISAIEKLLVNFTIPAWLLDKNGNILFLNDSMKELFGDLAGQNAALVYGDGVPMDGALSALPGGEGFVEVLLADVPFRLAAVDVDLGGEGSYRVEYYEDISENRLLRENLLAELAKVREETNTAKRIQRSILPADGVYWEALAVNSLYLPADDLGGDFFDVLRVTEDEFLLYVADVSGHGIRASLLTVFMQERVRANAALASGGVNHLLGRLVNEFTALEIDGSIYVTMVVCLYDRGERTLSVANAGHNCAPLIVRDNGRSESVQVRGMPISVITEEDAFEEEIVIMKPGDRLLLYTDGIVEEMDTLTKKTFGPEGVRETAERLHAYDGKFLVHAIVEEAAKYSLLAAKDDRTIVAIDVLS
ncbi:MAG: SpoIIE family protein phosphatase [Clostridiales Family XIII bacterium]|jgi:sigma-B regulation protein RsbU (phosphoserine phosphatase)|nr:SpoIIE family protein phosphatase [Clostridiales Family XIII bacterium]